MESGDRLGPYEIRRKIGAGGMGEVYEAEHSELGRRVAIKVLPDEVGQDETALRRFRKEARSASKLNHPNICGVLDFAHDGGRSFLVLEYLDGETLADLLERRGSLPLPQALRIGQEIAQALAHAHRHGFIHRDLKPANVMVTRRCTKILDFGLVRRQREVGEDLTTASTAGQTSLTDDGQVLGTVPYMAPEQLEGDAGDQRTDIYGLGVLLYEILSGKRPFSHGTRAAVIASILESTPAPLRALRPEVPDDLARTVERCLEKDPEDRWQSARDLGAQLGWIRERVAAGGARPSRALIGRLGWLVAAVLLAVVAGLSWLASTTESQETARASAAPMRFEVSSPEGVTFADGPSNTAALSPDGAAVAFVGRDAEGAVHLWLREFEETEARRLPGPAGPRLPFWSPAGDAIGYFYRRQLRVHSLSTGLTRELAEVSLESRGGTWNERGEILYAPDRASGLYLVPADGSGASEPLTRPDHDSGEIGHLWPQFLPDGNHFVYFTASNSASRRGIYIASLDDPTGRQLVRSATNGIYANGHLVYAEGSSLLAVPFDDQAMTIVGEPGLLASDVVTHHTFLAMVSASRTEMLAYAPLATNELTQLVWRSPDGSPAGEIAPLRQQRNPALSDDGRVIALERYEGTDSDIELLDLETGRQWRISDPATQAMDPILSPDGTELVYVTPRAAGANLMHVRTARTDPARILLESDHALMATDWSPDGRQLLLAERMPRGDYDVSVVAFDELGRPGFEPTRLLNSTAHEISGRFSRSGAFFAYASSESGFFQIYAQPFPPTGLKCQISAEVGYDPHWGPEDRSIYFLSIDGALMRAAVDLSDGCSVERPQRLFQTTVQAPNTSRNHIEVAPDSRVLLNERSRSTGSGGLAIVQNWQALVGGSPDVRGAGSEE